MKLFADPIVTNDSALWRAGRSDWTIAVSLFLLTLFSRLPFQSRILYHWDSVNFVFAMGEFNLAKEQPHPPGYILYVLLARLVDAMVADPPLTLVIISISASALAVAALYFLGAQMFDRRAGLLAAVFLATSPLFWFYSEIALPHTLDTLFVILSAWLLFRTMEGDRRSLLPAVILLALAGGVRQQTLVFMLPLLLFALRRVGWRRFLLAGAAGMLICLLWFVPLVKSSGGLTAYLSVMDAFGRRFQDTTSVFMGAGGAGLRRNLTKLAQYTAYGWGAALAALPFLIRRWPPAAEANRRQKLTFLAGWAAPALMFYSLIHMGQQGLVFIFLPAALLVSAFSLAELWKARAALAAGMALVIFIANAAIFCLAPEHPLGPDSTRLLTQQTLANSDRYYTLRIDAIRENFSPGSTLILAENWHHLEYYLPQYRLVHFNRKDDATTLQNDEVLLTASDLGIPAAPGGRKDLVIFDRALGGYNRSQEAARLLDLGGGEALEYYRLPPAAQLRIGEDYFEIIQE